MAETSSASITTTNITSCIVDECVSAKKTSTIRQFSMESGIGFVSHSKETKCPIPSFDLHENDSQGEASFDDVQVQRNHNITTFLTQVAEDETNVDDGDEGMGFDESDDDDEGSTTTVGDDVSTIDTKVMLEVRAKNLMERRAMHQQRHQAFLQELGLGAPASRMEERDETEPTTSIPQAPNRLQEQSQSPRGMIFKTSYNYHNLQSNGEQDEISLLQHLEQSYPYRQSQIRQLWSLVSPALLCRRQGATAPCHIPPPVFVNGPEGTGKSTIIRELLSGLKLSRNTSQNQACSRVGCAYVNCATKSSIDDILHDAYRQLVRDMKFGRQHQYHRGTPPIRRKRKKLHDNKQTPTIVEGFFARAKKQAKITTEQCLPMDDKDSTKDTKPIGREEAALNEVKDDEASRQSPEVRPRRSSRVRKEVTGVIDPDNNVTTKNAKPKAALLKEASLGIKATASPSADFQGPETNAVSRMTQVTVATFGQEVKHSLFKHHDDCAFLILDQAERLLSLPSTSSSKPNFLSQLLLIPQTKGLNLTIVVISRSTVLEHSRFKNSSSTLASSILPLKVHFHAYKGKEAFRQIMAQPTLLKRIVGPSMLASYTAGIPFVQSVVNSFLNVLVQSLYGSTRDLKEMIRLGRILWPQYVLPLHSRNLQETKEGVLKMCPFGKKTALSLESNSKEIVSYLDLQILPRMRQCLDRCFYSVSAEVPVSSLRVASNEGYDTLESMSYLTKCLMLAAFTCQNNRAEKDKQLFTIQKNGKKNSGNKKKSPSEDLAFGAAESGASKVFRPRVFPMERMLSVFVSIVGLNKDQPSRGNRSIDHEILPGSTGSADFFESLSQLRDIHVLHDKGTSMEVANLVAPKFWCSITRDEADVIAKSVSFPLEQFLI